VSQRRPGSNTSLQGCWKPVATAGADVTYVTLHVGLGTFQPLHQEQIETPNYTPNTTGSPPKRRQKSDRRNE
jgi:S-adenosylmethionine:tRNA-ribosyltransferase-isomerase (queuine synthetase)